MTGSSSHSWRKSNLAKEPRLENSHIKAAAARGLSQSLPGLRLQAGEAEKNFSVVQEYHEFSKESSCLLSQDISGSLTSYPCSGGREEEPREGMYIGRQCFVTCMLNLKDIQVVRASVSPFDLFHFYISRKKAADKWIKSPWLSRLSTLKATHYIRLLVIWFWIPNDATVSWVRHGKLLDNTN